MPQVVLMPQVFSGSASSQRHPVAPVPAHLVLGDVVLAKLDEVVVLGGLADLGPLAAPHVHQLSDQLGPGGGGEQFEGMAVGFVTQLAQVRPQVVR